MVIVSVPDFETDDGVYIEELLVCHIEKITLTIKAKLNFMQYIRLEDIEVKNVRKNYNTNKFTST